MKRRIGRLILPRRPVGAVRVIMNAMSEVAENAAVLDGLVRRIAERFAPDKIILFGSRARGDAAAGSDIDLLVLFSEVADPNQRAAELYASLVDFHHPMGIVVSTSSRFERYRNVVNTVYWPASREGKTLYERAA
jgi:predicted nucleotidyltransferase